MSLLGIGAFAQTTGLSIAALRHYDEVGLLKPAAVTPESGYRRYSPEQVPPAQLICGLRSVGLPIDEIREILGRPPGEVRTALDAHRERLAAQVRELSQRVRAVDEFIGKGTTMPPPQAVRPVQLHLHAADATKAAAFYTTAFDAVFLEPIASVQFGAYRSDQFFLLTFTTDVPPTRLTLLVPDVDHSHTRALTAGAAELHPPMEFSYRPRTSSVQDPHGNQIDLTQS